MAHLYQPGCCSASRYEGSPVLSRIALEELYHEATRDGDTATADAALRLLARTDPERAERLAAS